MSEEQRLKKRLKDNELLLGIFSIFMVVLLFGFFTFIFLYRDAKQSLRSIRIEAIDRGLGEWETIDTGNGKAKFRWKEASTE